MKGDLGMPSEREPLSSETLPTDADGRSREQGASSPPATLALAIAWASQPGLVGRVFVIPPDANGDAYVIGRGPARREDTCPRLLAAEERPGSPVRHHLLESTRLSRAQLLVSPDGGDGLRLRNVGQSRLFRGEREVDETLVQPGDRLRLGRQLLLLCVRRPAWFGAAHDDFPLHPFGGADLHGLVGESFALWTIRRKIELIARREAHVLVTGASGTGKEAIARALHARSARADMPMVTRNAATFPETLIDAELFGNAKNYPNPGMPERQGLFGLAAGSTLFLDELAEMPEGLQSHLLRVLDAGEYQRLGDGTLRYSRFCFIGATNRPERLRPELAARLTSRIDLPGLTDRREDIVLLVHHLLRQMGEDEHSGIATVFPNHDVTAEPRISLELAEFLAARNYQTHVRELEALLWQAIEEHAGGDTLHLPSSWVASKAREAPPVLSSSATKPGELAESRLTREVVERVLEDNLWVVEHAWRPLSLPSRHALNRLIARLGLKRPVRSLHSQTRMANAPGDDSTDDTRQRG
jgi:DNA-binding NtrC family response regulator